MPLIPFPDVPKLPGVPAIPRSSTVPTPTLEPTSNTNLPNTIFASEWAFVDENGTHVIIPDSFVDFEYREERKIPNYPVENGSFSSYNKVALPFDIRVTVACNGSRATTGGMSKVEFLQSIQDLMDSLALIAITTPDNTYENCNLIHADYRRESKSGVSIIIAKLYFQQVRVTQAAVVTTSQPSGTPAQNNGQVSPVPPTAKQQTQANNTNIDFAFLTKILNR